MPYKLLVVLAFSTSNFEIGEVTPIPTLSFVPSTNNVPESALMFTLLISVITLFAIVPSAVNLASVPEVPAPDMLPLPAVIFAFIVAFSFVSFIVRTLLLFHRYRLPVMLHHVSVSVSVNVAVRFSIPVLARFSCIVLPVSLNPMFVV